MSSCASTLLLCKHSLPLTAPPICLSLCALPSLTMAEPPGTPQPKFQFKMKMDMGQFLAKMEEKAAIVKKKGAAGLRTSKSKDGLSDFEQAKAAANKNIPLESPKLSPEEFQAVLDRHSKIAEYDVVTNLLQSIPVDSNTGLVDSLVKENQRVLDVVNYRLFELISTESFMQGVVQIGDIGTNLETSMVIAKNGRRVVQRAMEDFKGVFTVLQMVQRRHSMLKITEDLNRVQKVLTAHEQLQLAHSRGDYPEAVRLFLVCLENMRACSPLAVVNELASILQETYQLIITKGK